MVFLQPRYFLLIVLFAVLSLNLVSGYFLPALDHIDMSVLAMVRNHQANAYHQVFTDYERLHPDYHEIDDLEQRAGTIAREKGIQHVAHDAARSRRTYYVSYVPHNSQLGQEMGLRDPLGGHNRRMASLLWRFENGEHQLLSIDTVSRQIVNPALTPFRHVFP
uniref:Uncharacterized protein n=1 Tax=Melanopsichium pennsylvanicum 4 TaxID=1398559 RepID=A0A077R3A6_9BASI|nr:uncharacterized protein BN887_06300 [Melanopsichium pennsylvanicum 4]